MSQLARNRCLGSLLLLAYALSTTAAGLFHDHSHAFAGHHACSHQTCEIGHADVADHDAEHADCACDHDSRLAGETDSHLAGERSQSQPLDPADDEPCVICRFLGLSSLPVVLAALPVRAEIVAEVRLVEPRRLVLPLALTLHSRAPPQAV